MSGLIATLATPPRPAHAHAIILEAKPGVGDVVRGPDLAIRLRFNSRIDLSRSRLVLRRAGAPDSDLVIEAATKPQILSATAKGLAHGVYQLHWQVLSIDGHITRGNIDFSVAE